MSFWDRVTRGYTAYSILRHSKRQDHVTIVLYIVLQESMASSMGQDDEVSAPKMILKMSFLGGSDYNLGFLCGRQRIVKQLSFDQARFVTVIL